MVAARPPNIGSQRTPLARPGSWRFFINAVACRRWSHSTRSPAAPLKPGVGRSLNPNAPGHARGAPPAPQCGPDRAAVAWDASCRLRWAGAVGCVGRGGQDSLRLPVSPRPRAHGRWAPARRPAAHVAAQPRSQQTPLARPQTWAFFTTPSRAAARLDLRTLPAALLKLALGGPQPKMLFPENRWAIFRKKILITLQPVGG